MLGDDIGTLAGGRLGEALELACGYDFPPTIPAGADAGALLPAAVSVMSALGPAGLGLPLTGNPGPVAAADALALRKALLTPRGTQIHGPARRMEITFRGRGWWEAACRATVRSAAGPSACDPLLFGLKAPGYDLSGVFGLAPLAARARFSAAIDPALSDFFLRSSASTLLVAARTALCSMPPGEAGFHPDGWPAWWRGDVRRGTVRQGVLRTAWSVALLEAQT